MQIDSWRLHHDDPASLFTRAPSTPPHYRFDDPVSVYAVTYVNLDEVGAFLEVYGATQSMSRSERSRLLTHVASSRDLLFVDLDSAKTQKAFGLDARISSALEYATTRAWSRAWHDWYPDVDGIRYRSRHENDTLNLCLYLDRCGDVLSTRSSTPLAQIDRAALLDLVMPYGITVDL